MTQSDIPSWQISFARAMQRFVYWLSRHWLALANSFILLYVGVPFLAPVFMQMGWTGPARAIYTVYSALCHQLAFRSWFLFGEKLIYSFDEFVQRTDLTDAKWVTQFDEARRFVGNDTFGWKVALCQRDVAIYLAMLLGGLAFVYLRKRRNVRPMSLLLFVLVGLVPIGLDGGSQFLSLLIPGFPARESVWQLRTLTGALFGLSIVWLAFPNIEQGMREVREELEVRRRPKPPDSTSQRDKVVVLLKKEGVIPRNGDNKP